MDIDSTDYFALVEQRQDPPNLTREDLVILALVDDRRIPGHCAACGVSCNGYRWCPGCSKVVKRLCTLRGMTRMRTGQPARKYCKCGALVTKGKSAHRCDKCQKEARLAANREYWRKKHGRAA
jgi:hypothetical protein